jgi:hypothetical protein
MKALISALVLLCLVLTVPAHASVAPDRDIQSDLHGLFVTSPWITGYPFQDELAAAAARHGLPLPLVLAVARGESFFDPNAVSHKGAVGIMQVMPATAAGLGVNPAQLKDPGVNIEAGVRYLAERYKDFQDPYLALGAYYCGPKGVNQSASTLRQDCDEYVRYIHSHLRTILANTDGGQTLASTRAGGQGGPAGTFTLARFDNYLDAERFQEFVRRNMPALSVDLFRKEAARADHLRYEYHVMAAGGQTAAAVCRDLEDSTGFRICPGS